MPKRSSTRLTKRVVDAAPVGAQLWDCELSGFGLRVTPQGAKSFLVRYRAPVGTARGVGAQRYLTLGGYPHLTADQARSKAQEVLGLVAAGGDPAADRKAMRSAPTVQDLADYYLGDYASSRKLRLRTIADARQVLSAHALRSIGRRKVGEITRADIRLIHGDAAKAAGPYQANRLLAVLSRMFSLAEKELEWRSAPNPCNGIRKFPEEQRLRFLSEGEVGSLLAACDRCPDRSAGQAVRLLLLTGARLQEVLKAEWKQFDLDQGIWEKPSAHTKQKRQHRLELAGPALELLIEMRKADPEGEYLFPSPVQDRQRNAKEGDRRVTPRWDLKRPWAWMSNEAGLENVRLHDLRRTTASWMLSSGASLETVGKTLGHTQPVTTARYAQLKPSVQRDALETAGARMMAAGKAHEGKIVALSRS